MPPQQGRLLLLDFIEKRINLEHEIAQLLYVGFFRNQCRQPLNRVGHLDIECHVCADLLRAHREISYADLTHQPTQPKDDHGLITFVLFSVGFAIIV